MNAALSLLSAALDVALATLEHKDVIPDVLVGDILRIKREFHAKISSAVGGYLESGGSITRWRNIARKAVVDDHPRAFYTGFVETGGEDAETEAEDERWLTNETNTQLDFVDEMFVALRDLRGTVDADEEAERRADGYTDTLGAVYGEGQLRGDKNKMYKFVGEDGEESCKDCQRLKGKRMKAKQIIDDELIPAPGNKRFECEGYRCQHYWVDTKGNRLEG